MAHSARYCRLSKYRFCSLSWLLYRLPILHNRMLRISSSAFRHIVILYLETSWNLQRDRRRQRLHLQMHLIESAANPPRKVTKPSFVHTPNARSPIYVTPEGISIAGRFLQRKNAILSILFSDDGSETPTKLTSSKKALVPISVMPSPTNTVLIELRWSYQGEAIVS